MGYSAHLLADSASTPGLAPNANGQVPSMVGGVAPSTIWVPTVSQTINSGSDTSCFSATGQGPGQTIPANGPYAGNRYRLRCSGVYTTPLANTTTVTAKIKWGSTTVASNTTTALTSSLTNMPFWIEETCTIQTAGSSGTIVCSGRLDVAIATASTAILSTSFVTTSAAAINTTIASKIDITLAENSITGSATFTATDGAVEILY